VILKQTFCFLYFFLFIGLLSHGTLLAQDETLADSLYREDQIYLGVSFAVLLSDQFDFKPRGLSRHFQFGVVRDIPLSENGQFALGIGIGMSFERYNTNVIRSDDFNSNISYTVSRNLEDNPFLFSLQSLDLPLSIRWRNSSSKDYVFWRIYGGISFQWNYRIYAKKEDMSFSVSKDIQNIGVKTHLSFGYNTWNFYIAYKLTPFFNPTSFSNGATPFDISPLKIGLIFYLL
tara:strand:+ start:351 stop:1046 length:696 start_codon:yes stop_codon:yes gene_type:complete